MVFEKILRYARVLFTTNYSAHFLTLPLTFQFIENTLSESNVFVELQASTYFLFINLFYKYQVRIIKSKAETKLHTITLKSNLIVVYCCAINYYYIVCCYTR